MAPVTSARPAGLPEPALPADDLVEADDLKVHFPIRSGLLRRQTGTIRAVWTGYRTGIGEQMREHIERLLKEPADGH